MLINVWGAFSVIFLATYTANIAAHFAGLFLEAEVNDFHDSIVNIDIFILTNTPTLNTQNQKKKQFLLQFNQIFPFKKHENLFLLLKKQLMKKRTGTARSSASEGYLMEKYTDVWHHIQKYKVDSFDEGLENLR